MVFIGKNNAFTRTIVEGVRKYYSSVENVMLDVKYIEPKSLIPMEQQFIDFLTNKDNYNGAIIRPLCQLNDKTFEAFKQFCERTRVVL